MNQQAVALKRQVAERQRRHDQTAAGPPEQQRLDEQFATAASRLETTLAEWCQAYRRRQLLSDLGAVAVYTVRQASNQSPR